MSYPDNMNLSNWQNKGEIAKINGSDIFYIDTGGEKPVLLILHGYPSASIDYYKVIDHLAQHFRVLVHDHPGFGFSSKEKNYHYSLLNQADNILQLWQHLGIKSGHILAHDYGTSIATEILAKRLEGIEPVNIESVTLCNGSVHIELSHLRPIQKVLKNKLLGPLAARLSTKKLFARNMRKIYFDPDKISDSEINALWTLLTQNGGRKVLAPVTRYIDERYLHWNRWIGAWKNTTLPAHILWAENDPVAVIGIAKALAMDNPNAKVSYLPNSGHYPMLETPEKWVTAVLDYYSVNIK